MKKPHCDTVVEPPAFEDLVNMRRPNLDLVECLYGSGHGRYCNYRPYVNQHGLVYCNTCGNQIGCVHPECHS